MFQRKQSGLCISSSDSAQGLPAPPPSGGQQLQRIMTDQLPERHRLSLQDLPALALSVIHDALWECDSDAFCTSARVAAAFRTTCKRLHEAAQLPSMLKLSFRSSVPDMSSLKLLLSKPPAAGTLLSVRMTQSDEEKPKRDYRQKLEEQAGILLPFFSNLYRLGSHLLYLDMPCYHCVGLCLDFVCKYLVHLQHFTLRLNRDCEARYTQDFQSHGLSSLTLSVRPGSSPFMFGTVGTALNLSAFSELQLLQLQGPIVKLNEGHPFILPPRTRVIIDPALSGRTPTRWARQVASYEFSVMPISAIPGEDKYRDEDYETRKKRLDTFREDVIERAIERNGGPSVPAVWNYMLGAFAASRLKSLRGYLNGYLDDEDGVGLYFRSDLLSEDEYAVEETAAEIYVHGVTSCG
ncbi:hypothetical protein DUNSADRAFT_3448 [Dunaliella salina]|uniref:F-box domain-containing protein n=1 Tax=Dunaliella salina TaxID=3046 RepID=A0ABQ7GTY9_DUNSA|nr:hypothetical protein DUNSADRAFT_3448 [Dunaliella salina]|eukprot:KAF5838078.1 hypothetical protein DUNSADRAFT_3448 [Dunaliella salina]